MNAEQPIGFFDSGIGGLTVANAVLKALPNEKIIYFADNLHFPYGEKSEREIQSYAIQIADFLLSKHCKGIVIACNSASASAYTAVKEFVGNKAFVVDVIDPTIYYVKKYFAAIQNLGIIATRRTINSAAYANQFQQELPNLQVISKATPLLAPMVEEGFVNTDVSKALIEHYLSDENLKPIEAIVLACTHYPFIKTEIEQYYGESVHVLDTPTVVAEFLTDQLQHLQLLSNTLQPFSSHEFYVSELNEVIEETALRFFKHEFQLKEQNIFREV